MVVVPPGGSPDGPVVAAVRDLATDAAVLRQARDAAARSGAALKVVHAARSAREGAAALEDIEDWLWRWGTPPYSVHLSRGRPLEVVVDRSAHARLLVMGSAEPHRPLLGPAARGALRLAACPVLIAAEPLDPSPTRGGPPPVISSR
ncbi:universal stress protein [Pseudonocardia oroxyli]|uniref:Universal stress protein family protein n=1 Tax=Pseudonocardia oroxyli TaxID=366584 RepID=A0A1G8E0T6_PSEOR|nr:universal stress protein [Pseudonocardia oroxyli]SDH63299.1 hypothetical protein SAMN05216377_1304 [Pseudonocardia oroxyli]